MKVEPEEDRTLSRMNVLAVDKQDKNPRPYLGMSGIGHACDRKHWYDFRIAQLPFHQAASLYAFEDGHYSEWITSKRLRTINEIALHTEKEDGKQFGFSDLGGHFRGHMDGAIRGVLQAPKTWHVWEHKSCAHSNYSKFERLKKTENEKEVLKKFSATYYAQAILYMYYSKMKRHYMTVAIAGSRKYTSCRTNEARREAKRLIRKARDIITSDVMLDRVTEKEGYFECNMCNHKFICFGSGTPNANCRTCIHSAPVLEGENGEWRCDKHDSELTFDNQLAGCDDHLFIPSILKNFADVDEIGETSVKYINRINEAEFINGRGEGKFLSKEIANLDAQFLGDENINKLKLNFGAVVDEKSG